MIIPKTFFTLFRRLWSEHNSHLTAGRAIHEIRSLLAINAAINFLPKEPVSIGQPAPPSGLEGNRHQHRVGLTLLDLAENDTRLHGAELHVYSCTSRPQQTGRKPEWVKNRNINYDGVDVRGLHYTVEVEDCGVEFNSCVTYFHALRVFPISNRSTGSVQKKSERNCHDLQIKIEPVSVQIP